MIVPSEKAMAVNCSEPTFKQIHLSKGTDWVVVENQIEKMDEPSMLPFTRPIKWCINKS